MGRMILCTGKYATEPYYVNSLCVRVYCVEELCYLFAGNPFLIDSSVVDRKLVKWLAEQCDLKELAERLSALLSKGIQPGVFVGTILNYVNYCTEEEKNKIEEVLQSSAGLNEYERKKRQGDFFLKNRRYRLALNEYDDLSRQLPETESALLPDIYHNMGVACAGLFLYDTAAKYFKRAYEMSGREESGVSYLLTMRLYLKEEAYIAFIAENARYHALSLQVEKQLNAARGEFEASQENRMLSALKIYKEEGNVASYYEEIDHLITELKDAYRESVSE